ncbi:MAG: hypothetical protein WA849_12295 [Candidatus Udaeobacter sp.]
MGTGAGPNVVAGFNNIYIGEFVGTLAADESDTIRIGDVSNGRSGSIECYIGGIVNNEQPVNGINVVYVTIDLNDDHLGFEPNPSGRAPVALRGAPGTPISPAVLNGKVGKLEKLEATVAQQQEQIQTLTARLREQAAQIQKVSAQLEASKPAPQVVNNP